MFLQSYCKESVHLAASLGNCSHIAVSDFLLLFTALSLYLLQSHLYTCVAFLSSYGMSPSIAHIPDLPSALAVHPRDFFPRWSHIDNSTAAVES